MCSLSYSWVYSEKLEALNITIGEIQFCYLLFSVMNCVSLLFLTVGAEHLRRWLCGPLVLDSQIPIGVV